MSIQPSDPIFQGRCTHTREIEKRCISTARLHRLATQFRIPGRSRMNKAQLVHAICNVPGMTKERLFSMGATPDTSSSRALQRARTSPPRPSQSRIPPLRFFPLRTRPASSYAQTGSSTEGSSRSVMRFLGNFFRRKFPFRKRPQNWYRHVPNQGLPSTMNENNRMDPVSLEPMNRGIRLACGHWLTKDTFERVAQGLEYAGERQEPRCPLCRRIIRARDFRL